VKAFLAALAVSAGVAMAAPVADDDPNYWLSDIHGGKALAWAKEQTAHSEAVLKSDPRYAKDYADLLKSLDVPDRIPLGSIEHGLVYDFWQDAHHVRGLWRRTSVADYARPAPHWQTLIDVDKLDAAEHANWVFQGADCAPKSTLCLVRLSPGGGDAATVREFDLKTRKFVKGGFTLPVAKLGAEYLDANTIYFWTDFGPDTLTKSSYPRIVKLWHRGTPISSAKTIFEAAPGDVSARTRVFHGPYGTIALLEHQITFFTAEYSLLGKDGAATRIDVPVSARLDGATLGKLIFTLRDDWNGMSHGTLIAVDPGNGKVEVLYTPDAHSMVDGIVAGRDAVYASIYTDVTGAVHAFRPGAKGWTDTALSLPPGGSTAVVTADPWSGAAQFTYESFLTPPTLYATDGKSPPKPIKSQAPLFDASALIAEQFWATSSDGTRVPYFLVHRRDQHGPVPTILYSYGGFELSLTPWYWDDGHRPLDAAQVWIAKGGALAVANIRGGGEFGPAWHQAALREHRQLAFDDFASVARDLEARGTTTPGQLGIVGASNGGVLTTVTMTQHPSCSRRWSASAPWSTCCATRASGLARRGSANTATPTSRRTAPSSRSTRPIRT
jgi:prolyl oligopeptidase